MPPKTKITLTDAQKYEFCLYAHHTPGTRIEYVNWIENKWNVRVSESTVSRILQKKEERLSTEVNAPKAKKHRSTFQ
jgi:hypothetical protein